MRWLAVPLFLAACADGPAFDDSESNAIFSAVAPSLVEIVEGSWGPPEAWGIVTPGARTTLRIDLRLRRDTMPFDILGHLDESWAAKHIAAGHLQSTCPVLADTIPCERAAETMVIRFSPPRRLAPDSASVKVLMYRKMFGSTWEIVLRKSGAHWVIASKAMTMIT